jgi:hypothetical protein
LRLYKKLKSINRKGRKGFSQRSQSSVPIAIGSYRNESHGFNFSSFAPALRILRLKRSFQTTEGKFG